MAALQAYADDVSNPSSKNYRNFLTPAQIGAKFGQPQSTVNEMVNYLKSQGFTITLISPDNLHILADGTVNKAEAAFSTTINNFHALSAQEPGRQDYFAYAKPIQVPADLASKIDHVGGLQTFGKPQQRTTITPNQARVLYNTEPEFLPGMYGQGRTVAISSYGGFRLSNVPIFYSLFNLPTPPGGVNSNVTVETIDGGLGNGPINVEADLDIQMVLGQAPFCNFIIYDGNYYASGEPTDVYVKELTDNKADVISESYGFALDQTTAEACHTAHVEMTTEGITYMCASGDNGTTLEPYSYPDYDPEVLMVGGSAAQVDSQGNRQIETAWGPTADGSGGGGGWCTDVASFNILPSWQKATGVPTNINKRLVPDIAAHAAGNEAFTENAVYVIINGQEYSISGTSDASPMMAGDLAIAEQKLISLGRLPKGSGGTQRFGRIQDLFYKQNLRKDVWYDITIGSTGLLPNGTEAVAGTGWDFCTGLGAINWDAFVKSIVPPVYLTASSSGIYQYVSTGGATVTEGKSPTGTASLLANADHAYYSILSLTVPNGPGQEAAALINFTHVASASTLSDLNLTLVTDAPSQVTQFVYALNVNTGLWDPLFTGPLTGSDSTLTLDVNIANYVNPATNTVSIIDRGVLPQRFGNTPFRLNVDQAVLVESF